MKLSKRIRDLVRASLASPRRRSELGKTRSPKRLDAQLEQIRKSLTRAAGREKQLQDELARAEQEGRERDAIRVRHDLADLSRSTDELQAALDLIEARIEMEREAKEQAARPPSPTTGDLDTSKASLADEEEETDLSARKARKTRLAAPPEEKRGDTTDTQPR